jgi:hypothetical protein
MSDGLHIKFDTYEMRKQLAALAWEIEGTPGALLNAGKRAVNRALSHARSLGIKGIAGIYNVAGGDVKRAFYIRKGRIVRGEIQGRMLVWGMKRLPLSKFDASWNKEGVTVTVLRENGPRLVHPGGDKKIKITSRGRAATWIAKGHVMARTDIVDRPIILYGPNFMAYFRRPGVPEQLRDAAAEMLLKRLPIEARALKFGFAKVGGRARGGSRG